MDFKFTTISIAAYAQGPIVGIASQGRATGVRW